jgi:hypothetical protein
VHSHVVKLAPGPGSVPGSVIEERLEVLEKVSVVSEVLPDVEGGGMAAGVVVSGVGDPVDVVGGTAARLVLLGDEVSVT